MLEFPDGSNRLLEHMVQDAPDRRSPDRLFPDPFRTSANQERSDEDIEPNYRGIRQASPVVDRADEK
jgi:hypothetical protein